MDRVATVKTGSRQFKQLIHKLLMLTVEQSETLNLVVRDIVVGVCLSFQFHVGKTVCFG
jgi:hypothetical protein